MRGDSDLVVMIIIILSAVFIFSQILPKIVAAQTGTGEVTAPPVQDWTVLVVPGLLESTTVPKAASTPEISFVDAKDNCLLGEELARALGDSLNMTKIGCNCDRHLGPAEWKVCTTSNCTKTPNVVDVVNAELGTQADAAYVLTASVPDDFSWLCVQVEFRGDET